MCERHLTIKYALKDIEMFLHKPSMSAHDLLGPVVWAPNFVNIIVTFIHAFQRK